MRHVRLGEFALDNDWAEEEGAKIDDIRGLGAELAMQYNVGPSLSRYLQTLIAGPDVPLPYAPPSVRIVTSKEGWKEEYALVYGFPAAKGGEASGQQYTPYATRYPEEAVAFSVFYGANYGSGGYGRVEAAQPLDREAETRLGAGDFTDDEAERLLEDMDRVQRTYDELLIAARDPRLNPQYAERVNETFYQHAD